MSDERKRRLLATETEVETPERCKQCDQEMKFIVENDGILRRAFYYCSNCDDWTALWQKEILHPLFNYRHKTDPLHPSE